MNDPIDPHLPEPLPLGAINVTTEPFELVQRFGPQVLERAGIMMVDGPSGAGKTHAVKTMCAALDAPIVFLHLAARTRGHEVLRVLLARFGESVDHRGRELLERACDVLVGQRLMIFVDEADQLNRESLRQFRYLSDQPGMRFGLVMTGNDFRKSYKLVPEFSSRVTRRVRFDPLRGDVLHEALREHHPILAKTPKGTITRIDARYAEGRWRHWEHVLVTAADLGATRQTGITEQQADAVILSLAGKVG